MRKDRNSKKLNRKQHKTCLLFGEGLAENKFLSHLCGIYAESEVKYSPKGGKGGSPDDVINSAIRYASSKSYNYKLVVIDDDRKPLKKSYEAAKREGFAVIPALKACFWRY